LRTAGALLVFTGILYFALIPHLLRRVIGRTLLVLAPFLALAAFLVAVVLHLVPDDAPPLAPALLIGTIAVTGWLITFLAAEYRIETEASRLRRDTLYALRSEIVTLLYKLDNTGIKAQAKLSQARILAGETGPSGKTEPYYQFATMESAPIVFEAVSAHIPKIDSATVEPVLRFYAEYTDLRQMVLDIRDDTARALPPERRVGLHKELTRRRIHTLEWALRAYVAINLELGMENPTGIKRSGENPGIEP